MLIESTLQRDKKFFIRSTFTWRFVNCLVLKFIETSLPNYPFSHFNANQTNCTRRISELISTSTNISFTEHFYIEVRFLSNAAGLNNKNYFIYIKTLFNRNYFSIRQLLWRKKIPSTDEVTFLTLEIYHYATCLKKGKPARIRVKFYYGNYNYELYIWGKPCLSINV